MEKDKIHRALSILCRNFSYVTGDEVMIYCFSDNPQYALFLRVKQILEDADVVQGIYSRIKKDYQPDARRYRKSGMEV